jgi:mannose-6-phosphate isomerase-like protein (cupin superfamily)
VPELIESPAIIEAAGTPPKTIREHVGGVNTGETRLSVAHMTSPSGWAEPGQRPEFDEFTVVMKGTLVVEHDGGTIEVNAGQAIHTKPGEWVRYSTPGPNGADYIAVCLPAFSPTTVNRDH